MEKSLQTPPSGWDTNDRHLVGMPQSVLDDPRTEKSGYLRPLCNRCAAIPWSELPTNPRYVETGDLRIKIDELLHNLRDSPCRMCHLLWTIKPFGWLKYLTYVPAAPNSDFKGKLCFLPGDDVSIPKGAHPDLYGYLGILGDLERNLPFPHPSAEFVDLDDAQKWMKDCTASHGGLCVPDDSGGLQHLNVIDCETVRVIAAPESCTYVALSYVWGPPSEFAEEAYTFPTLPAKRSRTIEDAITVTKQIGYRYLWVDRYCINQNDPEHKMQQILQMGSIYSSAKLTIVAAAGSGPKHGLPGVSLPRRVPMPWGQVVGSVALVLTSVTVAQDVYNSTWAYRAWTFQEGYLSRRRLFFTDTTLLYVCGEDQKGDILANNYTLGNVHSNRTLELFLPWASAMPATKDWNVQSENLSVAAKHVKAFSQRRLTYDSDALNAILGILDGLSRDEKDPVYHIWGVPFAVFHREHQKGVLRPVSFDITLNWYHEVPCRRRAGFPSWSSIAWDGEANHADQDQLMVPDDIDVRILKSNGCETLEEYVKSGQVIRDSGAPGAPSRLKLIQVTTIPIKMADRDGDFVGVELQLVNNVNIIHHVSFDGARKTFGSTPLGVIIYRDIGARRMMIMILEKEMEAYERVGFMILDEDVIIDEELHRGLVRSAETGKPITDHAYLKRCVERPFRFAEETKQDVILG